MRMLINIRGCNGAGKSTIPIQMMEADMDLEVVTVRRGDRKSPRISVFHGLKWVALGTYYNKCGGMDTFRTTQDMREALDYAWKNYPDYDILMEGILASTVYSTYLEIFRMYEAKAEAKRTRPRKIVVLNFIPPFEVCLYRIYARNGGKTIKEEQVYSKWDTVRRNHRKFKADGVVSKNVDNSKISREHMLKTFLVKVEEWREE